MIGPSRHSTPSGPSHTCPLDVVKNLIHKRVAPANTGAGGGPAQMRGVEAEPKRWLEMRGRAHGVERGGGETHPLHDARIAVDIPHLPPPASGRSYSLINIIHSSFTH